MNETDAFRLLEPAWLLLLPLVWMLLWLFARRHWRQFGWRDWCDPRLLAKLESSGGSGSGRHRLAWILALVLTLAIVAASAPSWRQQAQPVMDTLSARVLVLELSRSTLVEDVRPNRFFNLLAAARKLLEGDFDGETGLVVYAGAVFVVSPLTSDSGTLLAFLDALSPEIMPLDGARVDQAIAAAQGLLDASMAGRGQVVVLTDGIDDVDRAAAAVLAATGRGHRVSLLASGTAEGGPLKDRAGNLIRDAGGGFRLEKTDYSRLRQIARLGKGVLLELGQNPSLEQLARYMPTTRGLFEGSAGDDLVERDAANEGYWLVWLMLPFTLLLFRRNQFWVLLFACWLPFHEDAGAVGWEDLLQHAERRAYEAFQRGDYDRVLDLSRDPLLKGSACYRLHRFDCAIDYFARHDSAEAQFNLGNAHAQRQQFPEAIVAYNRALDLDPRLSDALINLRLVEAYLRRQAPDDAALVEGSEAEESAGDPNTFGNAQPRIGMAGQTLPNPADSQQATAGLGASGEAGSLAAEDPFDGSEQRLEEFILRATGDREVPDPVLVERWLQSLPESSSELFRRIFMRDYQRQIRGQR